MRDSHHFYETCLDILLDGGVPFLVGGAFALKIYSGINRDTKDIDTFLEESEIPRALELFARMGMKTELTDRRWLAKAHYNEFFADLIFNSGNRLCPVTQEWFRHSRSGMVLDRSVRLVPPEEMIWQKAFIMERERYDGADVLHLILVARDVLDWARLRRLFGPHWRVLLSHLLLFGYVYPEYRSKIPAPLMDELLQSAALEQRSSRREKGICRGPWISRTQFAVDIKEWGFHLPHSPEDKRRA